jgi:hypothetical protein
MVRQVATHPEAIPAEIVNAWFSYLPAIHSNSTHRLTVIPLFFAQFESISKAKSNSTF